VHFGFDQTASMVAAPLLPDRPAQSFHRPQRFVAGLDAGAALAPDLAVAANRDDRSGAARIDGRVAASGVIGTVAANGDNGLASGICANRSDLPPVSPSIITRVQRLNTTAPAPAQARWA
jgi:hypothetical protein